MKKHDTNKPITFRQFYDMALAKVRQDPEWDESSLEYMSYLYAGQEKMPIGTHHFDVISEVAYGSNEGIICQIYMRIPTPFQSGGTNIKRVPLAVFKTLSASRGSYMEMGRLAAIFTYNAMQVAEEHLNDFDGSTKQ